MLYAAWKGENHQKFLKYRGHRSLRGAVPAAKEIYQGGGERRWVCGTVAPARHTGFYARMGSISRESVWHCWFTCRNSSLSSYLYARISRKARAAALPMCSWKLTSGSLVSSLLEESPKCLRWWDLLFFLSFFRLFSCLLSFDSLLRFSLWPMRRFCMPGQPVTQFLGGQTLIDVS